MFRLNEEAIVTDLQFHQLLIIQIFWEKGEIFF